jgi:hypothetical protein
LIGILEDFAEEIVGAESASEVATSVFGRVGPMYEGTASIRIRADAAIQTALLRRGADGIHALYPFNVAARTDDVLTSGQRTATEISNLLHDIFGPLPFRDIAVSPSWLTSDVRLLAQGIYDEKAFDRMPILADALQDAGCDNEDILNHCRAENWEHVRGCWVIDLLLGRPWREES